MTVGNPPRNPRAALCVMVVAVAFARCSICDSNVPLGFVSLTENLAMIAMAVWMIFGH